MAARRKDNRGSRGRRWCFTINNPTPEERERLSRVLTADNCYFAIVGEEVGASGTAHFQSFVHFKERRRLSECKKMLSTRAHFEVARGSDSDNNTYCSKDGAVIIRVGTPAGSGATRDTTNRSYYKAREVSHRLANGEDLLSIIERDDDAGLAYCKHGRFVKIKNFTQAKGKKISFYPFALHLGSHVTHPGRLF